MDFALTACTIVVRFPTTTQVSYDTIADYLYTLTEELEQPEQPLCEFVRAHQCLPDKSSARITFCSSYLVSKAVELAICDMSGNPYIVSPVKPRRKVVLRYLPAELSVEAVNAVLAKYGTVISHVFCVSDSVPTGTRVIEMELRESIPSLLSIAGHRALVYYSDQQRTCFSCGQTSHEKKDCPTAPLKTNVKSIVSPAPLGPEPIHSPDDSVLTNANLVLCSTDNCLVKPDLVLPNLTDNVSPIDRSTLLKTASDTAQSVEADSDNFSETSESSNPVVSICVRNLPFELSTSAIFDVFSNYGTVVFIDPCTDVKVPTGTRIVEMYPIRPIPPDLYVLGHPCAVTKL